MEEMHRARCWGGVFRELLYHFWGTVGTQQHYYHYCFLVSLVPDSNTSIRTEWVLTSQKFFLWAKLITVKILSPSWVKEVFGPLLSSKDF